MQWARVALRIPAAELHPMHAFVCESSTVTREVILEHDVWDDLTTLLLHVDGDRAAYEERLSTLPGVEKWTTEGDEDGFYVYVRTRLRDREAGYRAVLDRESVLIVPPVELRDDRTVRQTIVGRSDALATALDALPDGIEVDVLRTGAYARADGPTLSDRQREAVRAAWRVGYYELPREGDLAAVAARLDCSSSTASDLLRRAEHRLVRATLDTAAR